MAINPRYSFALIGGALIASVTVLAACATTTAQHDPVPAPTKFEYPATARGDVVDVYHGVSVADPYRALEDPDAQTTRDWVTAQNAVAQPFLESLPQRAWLGERLKQLWTYERFGVPRSEGGKYFYMRNDGTQDQSVLYVADALDAPPRVLVDPNGKREDATIALSNWEPSPDGSILAYALSDGGTDWNIWHFRRVADGVDLPIVLKFSKFWPVSWARDNSGVYYSRYPLKAGETADVAERGDDAGRPDVYFHALNQPQSADRLVYRVTDHPTRVPAGVVTEDGKYLIIGLFDGYETNGVLVQELGKPDAKPQPLFMAWDALYNFLGSNGDELYFQTTNGAPRGRVIAVDARNPAPAKWRTIVPHSDLTIASASYIGGRVVVEYSRDARSLVRLFDVNGAAAGEVNLPGLGTATGFTGSGKNPESFFSYSDYLSPTRILRLDVAKNAVSDFRTPKVPANFDPYVTEQVFYPSKDGTRVPMFIVHRKDVKRDGNQPVMLYGYGGFNVTLSPSFSPSIQAWLELGGVYAVANLRGGGEYGEEWHQAGTKLQEAERVR